MIISKNGLRWDPWCTPDAELNVDVINQFKTTKGTFDGLKIFYKISLSSCEILSSELCINFVRNQFFVTPEYPWGNQELECQEYNKRLIIFRYHNNFNMAHSPQYFTF